MGARISTFCHRAGGGGRHVCCEEITLVARGTAAGRLREAALPLLVPDLPVVLWLPGDGGQATGGPDDSRQPTGDRKAADPTLSPVACRLSELADAVIWSERGVEDRLPPHPHRSRQPVTVDLDWLRLQPWRELTAQLFDSLEHRPLLDRVEELEIVVTGPQSGRPGAGWLWVGWLASRLGWEYRGEATGRDERRLVGPQGTVTARARVDEREGLAVGEPLSVLFRVKGEAEPLLLERQPAPVPCDLWVTARGGRCVRLGPRDEAALLSEALGGTVRDRGYEAAWEMARRLIA